MEKYESIIEWEVAEPVPKLTCRPALQSTLSKTGNKKLVIISIVGPLNTGKSFLMSLIVKYLNSLESKSGHDNVDWLFDGQPMSGFYFENSPSLVTPAIHMSRPFFVGSDTAILLVDTPGIFEPSTGLREWAGVVGITMLLSSCTIFNVKHNLQEDSLVALQTFFEFATILRENSSLPASQEEDLVCQKILFVVRDWSNPSQFRYGSGDNFLEELLSCKNGMSKQAMALRQSLKASMHSRACFLLPFAGNSAMEFQEPLFQDDFDPAFARHLQEFFTSCIHPELSKHKKLNGRPVQGEDFVRLVHNYVNAFNMNFKIAMNIQNPVQIQLEMAILNFNNHYRKVVNQKLMEKVPPKLSRLEKYHRKFVPEFERVFRSKNKCEPKVMEKNIIRLKEQLEITYKQLENKVKEMQWSLLQDVEKDAMESLTAELAKLSISEQVSSHKFEDAWSRVRVVVEQNVNSQIKEVEKLFQEDFNNRIKQNFLQLYGQVKAQNAQKITDLVTENVQFLEDVASIYKDAMEIHLGDDDFISPERLEKTHAHGVASAKKMFFARSTVPKDAEEVRQILEGKLNAKIHVFYQELQRTNENALQETRQTVIENCDALLSQHKQRFAETAKTKDFSLRAELLNGYFREAKLAATEIFVSLSTPAQKSCEDLKRKFVADLEKAYEETLQTVQHEIERHNRSVDETLKEIVRSFHTHAEAINQKVISPEECAACLQKETEEHLRKLHENFGWIEAKELPSLSKKFEQMIDKTLIQIRQNNKDMWRNLQDRLRSSVENGVAWFDGNLPSISSLSSTITKEKFQQMLLTSKESTMQNFASAEALYNIPAIEIEKYQAELERRMNSRIREELTKFEKDGRAKIHEVKKTANEKMNDLVTKKINELENMDIVAEEDYQHEFSDASTKFLSSLGSMLTGVPETAKQSVIADVSEAWASTIKTNWTRIHNRNLENEVKIRSNYSNLKRQYFQEVLNAKVNDSQRITESILVQYLCQYKFSNPKVEAEFRNEIQHEFQTIDHQIKANEEKAREIENEKETLMEEFLEKIQKEEELGDDLVSFWIKEYVQQFSAMTSDESVLSNFREDLQREVDHEQRIRSNNKIAQMEKLLTVLIVEYEALLRKEGVHKKLEIQNKSFRKLEIACNKHGMNYGEYRSRLEDLMAPIFTEVDEAALTESKIVDIINQIIEQYREEMDKHFVTNKYYTAHQLTGFHDEAKRITLTNVPGARSDIDEINDRVSDAFSETFKEFDNKNLMNAPHSFAIGIDLGTTYSCVGVYQNGKVEVIPNDYGKKTTPSYVYYGADDEIVVGEAAKSQSHAYPERTIYEVKRLIGRHIDDEAIQEDIKKWPFQVVNEIGLPKVKVGKATYFPEEVSSQVLRKMKQVAEDFLNREVTAAVITVPAYFTEGQKASTKLAGEQAGLEVLRIITEPTAAAIAYNLNWTGPQKPIKGLVYDFGGGTFDVALFTATKGNINIVNVGGDTHLGGVDFDNELVTHCCRGFHQQHGVDLLQDQVSDDWKKRTAVNRKLMRLKRSCEQYKIALSVAESTTIAMENIHEGIDLAVRVVRDEFESMIDQYIDKSLACVEKVLREGQMTKDDIDEIVLIGGSTRIPRVQAKLMEYFDKALNSSINPDEAVAVGAAYEAAVLNGRRLESRGGYQSEFTPGGVSVQDITPMSYGIEIDGGDMCVLIPKQSRIPTEVSNTFVTSFHHQTSVQIVIYEGDHETAAQNTMVGEFYLNGIPPGLAGQHRVQVTMKVDAEGMITVSAVCEENGESKQLTVRANKRRVVRNRTVG